MFGVEAILAIASNGVGIVSGLMANAQKAKADEQKLLMERLTFDKEMMQLRSELSNKEFQVRVGDKFSSMTRRVLVLGFMAMIFVISAIAPWFSDIGVAVPVEVQKGWSFLFWDNVRTEVEYQVIKDAVVFPEWAKEVAIMIFSFYVGASAVKR